MSELKPCPFCGSIPEFSPIYDPDERRHIDMDLECCVTMTARISYPEYTAMNSFALKDALQAELTREWNRRTQPEATKPAPMHEAARLIDLWLKDDDVSRAMHSEVNRDAARKITAWPELLRESSIPAQDLSAAILALPEDEILQAFANAVGNERDGAKSCYVTTEEVVAFVKYHLAPLVSVSPADALVAGDRVDTERTGTLYQAVQRAAGELPEGWTICLEIERDAGTVELIDPEGNRKLIDGNDGYLCQAVNEATNAAIQAQKDGHD